MYFSSLVYGKAKPVFNHDRLSALDEPSLKGATVVLVTGIAKADSLRDYLVRQEADVTHLSFPDHHSFTQGDLDYIMEAFNSAGSNSRYVITTEKDAVRLREFTNIAELLRESFYFIPVTVAFHDKDINDFDNLILEYVRKNKPDS